MGELAVYPNPCGSRTLNQRCQCAHCIQTIAKAFPDAIRKLFGKDTTQ